MQHECCDYSRCQLVTRISKGGSEREKSQTQTEGWRTQKKQKEQVQFRKRKKSAGPFGLFQISRSTVIFEIVEHVSFVLYHLQDNAKPCRSSTQ